MDVFVYGTLTNPERVRAVVDSFVFVGPAVLEGLRVVDGEYPTLAPPIETPDPEDVAGARVAGRLLRTDDVDALDAYEGVDDGLFVRVTVPVDDDGGVGAERERDDWDGVTDEAAPPVDEAAVYVGDPARLGADATWPGDGPFAERVRATLETLPVRVHTRPSV
jgi:gamma-glutamylcyclotransferase (GGCT)/AIG2-like uncharacterized protein YtfP